MAKPVGRATQSNPPNRFESIHVERDDEHLQGESTVENSSSPRVSTEFYRDTSRSLIRENDSPDIPFRYSINPYRGCEHGCAYCYARPGHETLGFGAGLDFETKIMVKTAAAELLRKELCHPRWSAESITMSGVTDCYQPAERQLRITRSIVEVLVEARQAFGIITKNALVTRDLDLLSQAASWNGVHVFLSVTSLDAELVRCLEPRTSTPAARLRAVASLAAAGVPTGVMVAPIIPGLNDEEIPAILQAAKVAGAQSASSVLLRLPLSVRPVFESWLESHLPEAQRNRIVHRIQDCRGGKMNSAQFGSRMSGTGPYAAAIQQTFATFAAKFKLNRKLKPLESTHFRPPQSSTGQRSFF